jgi:hypothetical protein
MQLRELLIESRSSSRFQVNSNTCFDHTGPSSGTYNDIGNFYTILYYIACEDCTSEKVYYLIQVCSC